jgi:deoxycytidylate deaminase
VAERPTWDETWLDVARAVSLRSACGRDGVGAVVVDRENRLLGSGYNGPPRGMSVSSCPREAGGPKGSCTAVHAELNALLWGDRREREGGTLYVTRVPCRACSLAILNSGVSRCVVNFTLDDYPHVEDTRMLFKQARMQLDVRYPGESGDEYDEDLLITGGWDTVPGV